MTTRYFSDNQEKHIAKVTGGKVQSNSGGTKFGGGDVHTKKFFIEAKTPTVCRETFTIKKDWMCKMREQMFEQGKECCALAFTFDPNLTDIGDIIRYPEALEYIAKVCNGGMRDAITLLDKCLSLSHDLTLENVLKTIGGEDYSTFITFLSALLEREKETSIKVVEDVYNAGKDVKQFMKDFAKFILEVEKYALYQNFNYINLPNTLEDELEQLIDDSLFGVMDFVVSLNNQIKWENDAKTLIELSILIYCGKEN